VFPVQSLPVSKVKGIISSQLKLHLRMCLSCVESRPISTKHGAPFVLTHDLHNSSATVTSHLWRRADFRFAEQMIDDSTHVGCIVNGEGSFVFH
jgi:hypothetical protein